MEKHDTEHKARQMIEQLKKKRADHARFLRYHESHRRSKLMLSFYAFIAGMLFGGGMNDVKGAVFALMFILIAYLYTVFRE